CPWPGRSHRTARTTSRHYRYQNGPPPMFIPGTNAIESVNARIRKAVRARGHLPNGAAALKCVYLAIMSLDPTGQGRKRRTMRWKPALQAFDIAFDGRLSIGRR
ncbi:transposase, partial [Streptomyces sp. NPDC052107]|uniref:transposase n=1 Tax=Streptomyces sp. NPDC052107 TaxID=3155632 RepID=UPI003420594B